MRNKVTAERAREFCEWAQKKGTFNTVSLNAREGTYIDLNQAAMKKGLVEKVGTRGGYKWIGPADVTILTGEAVFRQYTRQKSVAWKKRAAKVAGKTAVKKAAKSNGVALQPGESLRAQIKALTARVDALEGGGDLKPRLDQMETAIGAIMREIG